jgi:hypothetical protein
VTTNVDGLICLLHRKGCDIVISGSQVTLSGNAEIELASYADVGLVRISNLLPRRVAETFTIPEEGSEELGHVEIW